MFLLIDYPLFGNIEYSISKKYTNIRGGIYLKIKESAENYLETILKLKKRNGYVRSIDIVNDMGFSKPSVSNAMKQFRNNGYITVDIAGHIELTQAGKLIAEKVSERHELITEFLESIGVDPKIAADDACRMEHYVSDETFDKLKYFYHEFLESKSYERRNNI